MFTTYKSLDRLVMSCGGRLGWGCTSSRIEVDCECIPDGCGGYRARINMLAQFRINAVETRTGPSVATIQSEEIKHVAATLAAMANEAVRGESLERLRFPYQWLCGLACSDYKIGAYARIWLSAQLVHVVAPHPY